MLKIIIFDFFLIMILACGQRTHIFQNGESINKKRVWDILIDVVVYTEENLLLSSTIIKKQQPIKMS